jgi:hypothetical protein
MSDNFRKVFVGAVLYTVLQNGFSPLKGQSIEIFNPRFFRQTISVSPLIYGLKPFQI